MKKYINGAIALLVLCAMLLSGCQGGSADYTVTLVDGNEKPYTTGIVVQIMKGSKQVAMKAVGEDGKVTVNLPLANYTVELRFTGDESSYFYEKKDLTLSAQKTELQVQVIPAAGGQGEKVFDSDGESIAYTVTVGETFVKLKNGGRCYFLFSPPKSGLYRFTTSDSKAAIGNYGYTAYIQKNTITEVKDNTMQINVTDSMVGLDGGSNPYVLGIDADGLDNCTLIIERMGEYESSVEESAPWVIYETTAELKPFTLPEGEIKEFDLTAETGEYNVVLNETDGFYHLNSADGPLVLVQLGKPTKYLPSSVAEICTTTGVKKYFYDDNGEFVKREDYTQCLQEYSYTGTQSGKVNVTEEKTVYLDNESGLYPLTEDLKYIIQNHGEYVGWWDEEDPGFIFEDEKGGKLVGLNSEIAWLFLCCYLEN